MYYIYSAYQANCSQDGMHDVLAKKCCVKKNYEYNCLEKSIQSDFIMMVLIFTQN